MTEPEMPEEVWLKRGGHQEGDYVNALPIPGHSTHYLRADKSDEKDREIERLQQRLEKAEEVIAWYADKRNYERSQTDVEIDGKIYRDNYFTPILGDVGSRARDYLSGVKGER